MAMLTMKISGSSESGLDQPELVAVHNDGLETVLREMEQKRRPKVPDRTARGWTSQEPYGFD